jgi:hypothetical protein
MEAGSHSGTACLVQQSLGTSALFPSYVFVTRSHHVYYTQYYKLKIVLLQIHNSEIQQYIILSLYYYMDCDYLATLGACGHLVTLGACCGACCSTNIPVLCHGTPVGHAI